MTSLANSSLLSCFFLVFLFISPSSSKQIEKKPTDDINVRVICSKTTNPTFCSTVLNSQITKRTDIRSLAKITIRLAYSSAKENYAIFGGLLNQTTSPVLKQRYASCSNKYNLAISGLGQATQSLNSGNYKGVYDGATSAFDAGENCEDEFEVPPPEDEKLKRKTTKFVDLSSIVLAVSDYLH
ncbi:hypothetical protein LguiA_000943 [Lonicera macranthoides]